MMPPIHLIIIDNQPIFRLGIIALIKNINRINCVISFEGNSEELLEYYNLTTQKPDLCILDITSFESNVEILRLLKNKWIQLKFLIFSNYKSKPILKHIAKNDVYFFSRNTHIENVQNAIGLVCNSNEIFSSGVEQLNCDSRSLINLTRRERELLGLMCSNLAYKQIAEKLNISKRTVEIHRDNLFKKLQVNSRAALVTVILSSGIVYI